jgi:hypothetical protein
MAFDLMHNNLHHYGEKGAKKARIMSRDYHKIITRNVEIRCQVEVMNEIGCEEQTEKKTLQFAFPAFDLPFCAPLCVHLKKNIAAFFVGFTIIAQCK